MFIFHYFPISLILSVLFSILVLFSSCLLSIVGRIFYFMECCLCPLTGFSEVTELCHCYQYNFSTTLHTSIVLLDTSVIISVIVKQIVSLTFSNDIFVTCTKTEQQFAIVRDIVHCTVKPCGP